MFNLNNPYFLLLFLMLFLLWIFPKRKYYLTLSWALPVQKKFNYLGVLKNLSLYLGWMLIVIAAIDPLFGMKLTYEKQLVHKYVFLNDASGSMVENNKEQGIGKRLSVLMKGNKAFLDLLDKRDDKSKDLIGAIVFADSAFIVSYIVDDPPFVYKKLSNIDYRVSPLNQGTRIDEALWAGIDMLIFHSSSKFYTDLNSIKSRMYGEGLNYKNDNKTKDLIKEFKDKISGDSLIIFTDGEFFMPQGNDLVMSTYKLLNLCKDLGIKVYAISVEKIDPMVASLCKASGGFAKVLSSFDNNLFIKTYENILNSQPKEYLQQEGFVNISYANWIGFVGLMFLTLWMVLKNTFCLNYVEV